MGYNWSAGMSERAVDAYEHGELPASKMATAIRRLAPRGAFLTKCSTADVRATLATSSYHHTSKFFNATDFYNYPDQDGLDELSDTIRDRLCDFPAAEIYCPDCGSRKFYPADYPGRCFRCQELAEAEAGFETVQAANYAKGIMICRHITQAPPLTRGEGQ